MRKTLLLSAICCLLSCAKSASVEKSPTPVEVITVAGAANDGGLRYSASVKPDWQIDLAFRVGGYVDDVRRNEGDRVRKGEVLAHVRQADYADKVAQAGGTQSEANAGLEKAKRDFDRAQKLFATNSITRPELDAARAQLDAAQARVDSASAVVREARLALGDASLIAPADAVVLRRYIERGALVGPGLPAFSLADTRNVKVAFGVPDIMVDRMRAGAELTVACEALHRDYRGRITRVAPAADPKARVFEIEVTVPNTDGALKPGMIATMSVGQAPSPVGGQAGAPVLHVPLDAIVRSKIRDQYAVFVVDASNRVHTRDVVLGEMTGNMIGISGGLAAGERVITKGSTIVNDGDSVQVMP